MAKVTIDATQLKNVDVRYVSLVKRGANRIPFRIIKQEKPMINLDLSRIFKRDKTPEPVILGVVVAKDEDTEVTQAAIKEAGFSIETRVEKDECVIYQQGDSIEGAAPVKLNSHVALLVRESALGLVVEKAEGDWAKSFFDQMKSDGFYPAVSPVMYYLESASRQALYSAATPEEASKAVGEVIDAFKGYVLAVVNAIPQAAFKMGDDLEEVLADATTKSEEGPESPAETPASEASETPAAESAAESETPADEPVADDSEPAASVAGAANPDQEATPEAELVVKEPTEVMTALKGLTELVGGLKAQLDSVSAEFGVLKQENADLKGKLTEVEGAVQAASNTILGGAPNDKAPSTKQDKEPQNPVGGLIDTGLMPHLRKKRHR